MKVLTGVKLFHNLGCRDFGRQMGDYIAINVFFTGSLTLRFQPFRASKNQGWAAFVPYSYPGAIRSVDRLSNARLHAINGRCIFYFVADWRTVGTGTSYCP